MIKTDVDLEEVVKILNEACSLDSKAMFNLVNSRVYCNEELSNHPTIQVGVEGNKYKVGLVGVLNGLFGTDEEGWGCIAADIDEEKGTISFGILEDRIK